MQDAIGAGSITAAMILSLVALALIWNLIKSYAARRRLCTTEGTEKFVATNAIATGSLPPDAERRLFLGASFFFRPHLFAEQLAEHMFVRLDIWSEWQDLNLQPSRLERRVCVSILNDR